MSTSTASAAPRRRAAQSKNWWMKWEFARWLNEPTLITAGNHVQGFWFNLLNRMGIAQSPTLEDTPEGYALLGLCREGEVASRLHALRMLGIADVEERGGRVRVTCRSMVRQMEISQRRSEAAQKRWKDKRAAAGDESAEPADTGFVHTHLQAVLHMQNGMQVSNSSFNSCSIAVLEEEVQEEKPAPPLPEQPEDLRHLTEGIVLAHPRARMRNWRGLDIPPGCSLAVEAAIRAEMDANGETGAKAAEKMLQQVQRIAREVPELQWGFLKDIEKFFNLREYRIEPRHLTRGESGPVRVLASQATVGMAVDPRGAEGTDKAVALDFWRMMQANMPQRFEREAPRWAREQLAVERCKPPGRVAVEVAAMALQRDGS